MSKRGFSISYSKRKLDLHFNKGTGLSDKLKGCQQKLHAEKAVPRSTQAPSANETRSFSPFESWTHHLRLSWALIARTQARPTFVRTRRTRLACRDGPTLPFRPACPRRPLSSLGPLLPAPCPALLASASTGSTPHVPSRPRLRQHMSGATRFTDRVRPCTKGA
jgi:hypothetical protein